jgi:ribonuclease P protein component
MSIRVGMTRRHDWGSWSGGSFGTHVARNRVKRRLRAAARPLWERLPHGYDLVCVARPPAATAPMDALREQFQRAFQQGGVL